MSYLARMFLQAINSDIFALICVIAILVCVPMAMWVSMDKKGVSDAP